jgi:hypothetical protein
MNAYRSARPVGVAPDHDRSRAALAGLLAGTRARATPACARQGGSYRSWRGLPILAQTSRPSWPRTSCRHPSRPGNRNQDPYGDGVPPGLHRGCRPGPRGVWAVAPAVSTPHCLRGTRQDLPCTSAGSPAPRGRAIRPGDQRFATVTSRHLARQVRPHRSTDRSASQADSAGPIRSSSQAESSGWRHCYQSSRASRTGNHCLRPTDGCKTRRTLC